MTWSCCLPRTRGRESLLAVDRRRPTKWPAGMPCHGWHSRLEIAAAARPLPPHPGHECPRPEFLDGTIVKFARPPYHEATGRDDDRPSRGRFLFGWHVAQGRNGLPRHMAMGGHRLLVVDD